MGAAMAGAMGLSGLLYGTFGVKAYAAMAIAAIRIAAPRILELTRGDFSLAGINACRSKSIPAI